tara:strand:- start:165253 stop:166377 length:1125 start_codon:yes stop_codon:yes gene_type:complete
MLSWAEIDQRLGRTGLEGFSDREIVPQLEEMTEEGDSADQKKALKSLQRSFTIGFFSFGIFFFVFAIFVPDDWWGIVLKFVLFPVVFLGTMALTAFLRRETLMKVLFRAQGNFMARAAALKSIADHLQLVYVPTPGGAPEHFKMLAKFRLMPKKFGEMVEMLDQHGGLDEAVDAATKSGLLAPDAVVLGNEKDKERYYRQTAMGQSFEDGFEGERSGIGFSAFEWIETVDEAPDRYHLLLLLRAPHRLNGVTHLRSRKTPWPRAEDSKAFSDVHVVPETFNDHFRLRSTDQVEARTIFNPAVIERVLALAHGEAFRAVARDDQLVFDIVGENRFNLIDLQSAHWDTQSIRKTFEDIVELMELVDEMSHAFMVYK